jgi:alpha-tubulin suppressor-like RCC1 family protein
LNNHGQLGFKTEENIVRTPTLVKTIDGEEVVDIRGGEHHTLFLMKTGKIYGAG